MEHFHGAVNELQDGLSDLQEQLQKILIVVQGEQERSATIEKSSASDHASILELDQRVASAKSFREKDLLATNMHRKDINALEAGLAEACRRLDAHDTELDVVRSRAFDFERSADAGNETMEGLALDLRDVRHTMGVNAQESCQLAIQMSSNMNNIENLGTLVEEMRARSNELRVDHDRTTSSHNDVSRTLQELSIKVQGETSRLSDACHQVTDLERQALATTDSTDHLHAVKDQTSAQLRDVEERLLAATTRVDTLQTESQRMIAVERGHSQQLDDANRHIQHLDLSGCEMASHLKQMRVDMIDVHVTLRKREEQTTSVINALTTLDHNMKNIDEQVLDVQTMLKASDTMALGY